MIRNTNRKVYQIQGQCKDIYIQTHECHNNPNKMNKSNNKNEWEKRLRARKYVFNRYIVSLTLIGFELFVKAKRLKFNHEKFIVAAFIV